MELTTNLQYGLTIVDDAIHILRPGCETGVPWTLCGAVLDAIVSEREFVEENLDRLCPQCQREVKVPA